MLDGRRDAERAPESESAGAGAGADPGADLDDEIPF